MKSSRSALVLGFLLLWASSDTYASVRQVGPVRVTNLGLSPGRHICCPDPEGGLIVWHASELEHGVDLNGDGDAVDRILHLYEERGEQLVNTQLASEGGWAVRGRAVFRVWERSSGRVDFNGDGDQADHVLHLYDSADGSLINLGYSALNYRFDGRRVTFVVSESQQGNNDLNGDGDLYDTILHIYDLETGEVTDLGVDAAVGMMFGRFVVLWVSEEGQGRRDLNGDGDARDSVVHIYDTASMRLFNLGLAGGHGGVDVAAGLLAFSVSERGQDHTDLNQDGDTDDSVVYLLKLQPELREGAGAVSTGLSTSGSFYDLPRILENRELIVLVPEYDQGRVDLNGDGDVSDRVLVAYDIRSRSAKSLRLPVSQVLEGIVAERRFVAVQVSETAQGERDLNGDKDILDHVVHTYDARSGTVTNLGVAAAWWMTLVDDLLVFRVVEAFQGNMDLNGDGDTLDAVLHAHRPPNGGVLNIGLSAHYRFDVSDGRIAFLVDEGRQAASDLNSDGDTRDFVLHLWDSSSGRTYNLGLASDRRVTREPKLGGDLVTLVVSEEDQGDQDLNGDADSDDFVWHVGTISSPKGPLSLRVD